MIPHRIFFLFIPLHAPNQLESLLLSYFYLAAYLISVQLAWCPVTLTPLTPTKANQIAHFMLPQSGPRKAVSYLLNWLCSRSWRVCRWNQLLKCWRFTKMQWLCIHSSSRLFLVPCMIIFMRWCSPHVLQVRFNVHSLTNNQRSLMISPKETLQLRYVYCSAIISWTWRSFSSQKDPRKMGLVTHTPCSAPPLWGSAWPSGRLYARPYRNFPPIESHIYPFAIFLHA